MRQSTRWVTAPLTVFTLALGGVFVPTVTLPLPEAHAVPPDVDSVPFEGIDASAVRDRTSMDPVTESQEDHAEDHRAGEGHADEHHAERTDELVEGQLAALSPQEDVSGSMVAGVTWDQRAGDDVTEVDVRLREKSGWGEWQAIGIDQFEMDGTRAGTEPIVLTGVAEIQARVSTESGRSPSGLRVDLIDPGRSAADEHVGDPRQPAASANAGTGNEIRPDMVTRAGWGADESLRSRWPEVSGKLNAIYLHHTAGSNSYTRQESAAVVRGIYGYHTRSRGWPDIGYQFLVDKFGTVFIGRKEAAKDNPMGAHAGGYNTGTIGVSAMGNFESARPPRALVRSIEQVIAWKAYYYNMKPMTNVTLRTGGSTGSGTRADPGTDVRVPRILGHRTTNVTSCPGRYLYDELPSIRRHVRDRVMAARDRYGHAQRTTSPIDAVGAKPAQKPIQWFSQSTYQWRSVPGAARYQVLQRFSRYDDQMPNGPYWRKVKIVDGTSASLRQSRGYSVEYGVRPIDRNGQYGPIERLVRTTRPVADSDVQEPRGPWWHRTKAGWYGGEAWFTDVQGARLRVHGSQDVRQIRVMAPTAPGNGRVRVYVGTNHVGVINLDTSRATDRTVFTISLPRRMSGKVDLKAADAGKVVRISAIGISRW